MIIMATMTTQVNGCQNEGSMREAINDLCLQLALGDDISTRAASLANCLSIDQSELKSWAACLIYIASIDSRLPYGPEDPESLSGRLCVPPTTVSDILITASTTAKTFLCQVSEYKQVCGLSSAVLQHFYQLECNFLITCPLYHKYHRLLGEIFRDDKLNSETSVSDGSVTGDWEKRRALGWLLFIFVKGIRNEVAELVSSFHLLICCLDYLIKQTPTFLLKSPYDEARLTGESSLLGVLCGQCQTNQEQVQQIHDGIFSLAIGSLPDKDGSLMEDIKIRYTERHRQRGDLNEILFLEDSSHLQLSHREPNNNSSLLTDSPHPTPQQTPVRKAMATINQLTSILYQCTDRPSDSLIAICQGCPVDLLPGVVQRVSEMADRCINDLMDRPDSLGPATAQQRFIIAKQLYYKSLEAMLTQDQEEERMSTSDLNALLQNANFHLSLFATSVEVVMATYSTPSVTKSRLLEESNNGSLFPWILSALDIHAYHMLRVMESFVKALPTLHQDIVKHLQRVECQILIQTIWQSGSPLLSSLTHSSLIQPESSPNTKCVSPMRTRNGSCDKEKDTAATKPSPWRQSHSMSYFFNKVSRLAYQRLNLLCSKLTLPEDLHREAWVCVEKCLAHHTHLLINRHLDQILMCSIYGVCKVCDHDLKFKAIVGCYLDLPLTTSQTYKSVMLSEGKYDTIIVFYNKVFMLCVKTDLLQCATNRNTSVTSSPGPRTLEASPVFTLPGAKNFYVSPLKQSPFKTPISPGQMTPRTRHLYSFGESLNQGGRLRSFNQQIRAHAGETPPDSKRARFSSPGVNSPRTLTDFIHLRSKPPSASTRKSLNFADHPSPSKPQSVESGKQNTN